jgi:hypothetical protein
VKNCRPLTLQDKRSVYLFFTLSWFVKFGRYLVLLILPVIYIAQQTRISFVIVRIVLASIHNLEMKKTHGWQSSRDGFLAVVVE